MEQSDPMENLEEEKFYSAMRLEKYGLRLNLKTSGFVSFLAWTGMTAGVLGIFLSMEFFSQPFYTVDPIQCAFKAIKLDRHLRKNAEEYSEETLWLRRISREELDRLKDLQAGSERLLELEISSLGNFQPEGYDQPFWISNWILECSGVHWILYWCRVDPRTVGVLYILTYSLGDFLEWDIWPIWGLGFRKVCNYRVILRKFCL